MIVKIRAVDEESGLLAKDARDARMRVTERVHADAGDQIQVALAIHVREPGALALAQNDWISAVVLQ